MADDAREPTYPAGAAPRRLRQPRVERAGWRRGLLAGGTEGNERLTVLTGLLLIVLLAVLGVTIIRIGQLLWLHLFLGLVLLGPVALKLGSTGYRFARYYTSDPAYREKSLDLSHQIQMEDAGICEQVQHGLASGAFDVGRFSVKRENAGYHFHKMLANCLK